MTTTTSRSYQNSGDERKEDVHFLELAQLERATSSLRRADKFDKAASRISDALEGVLRPQPLESRVATLCFHVHLYIHVFLKAVVVPALVGLTFFERPAWCSVPEECECVWVPEREEECPHPTFHVFYVSDGVRLGVEGAFLAAIFLHQLVLRVALGPSGFWSSQHRFEFLAAAFLAVMPLFRISKAEWVVPLCRLLVFIAYSDDVRSQLRTVARVVPHYLRVGALLGLLTLFFGWFGVVLFPTDEQVAKTSTRWPSEGDAYFPNLREGMWNLLVLVTTANFPDVAIPGYMRSRWSMLFFIAYLLIGMFFMMNLLLATVYNVYQEEQEKAKKIADANRDANLKVAYDLLKNYSGTVDAGALRGVFAELNQHREIKYINDERSEFLLSTFDAASSSAVDFESFHKICTMIEIEDKEDDDDDDVISGGGTPSSFRATVARFVGSPFFEYGVDLLVLFNAVAVAVQTRDEILGHRSRSSEDANGLFWEVAETALALFYLAEMIAKVYAFGFRKYVAYKRNQLDAAVAIASTITTLVVYSPNAYDDSRFVRYVLMIRLARLVRVLEAIPDFQVIGEAFLNVLPLASRLLKFLFCATFFAAVVGMALFGGAINTGPNLDKLKGTGFYEAGYAPLNFNDLWSAFVTLFAILVVNNWQVVVEGFVAVAGVQARLFFIAFYSAGVLIGVNLAVAFIIDTFSAEFEKTKEKHLTASQHKRRNSKNAQRSDANKRLNVELSLTDLASE
mmetsp:Transcript_24918/g.80641  ORF Transcript_24918/g.80641 Transcript_24918/m.80641 type:complete len:738 (-) Transcript_24918:300-2513(-)